MNVKNTFIVAEMACSHEGDLDLAKKIIDASASGGANAIQLQIWAVEHMMSPGRPEYDLLTRIEFSQTEWSSIVHYCRSRHPKMKIYACVYEHHSIDFIASLGIDGFKLNSSDLSNPLVLDSVARCGKPINLSVGASEITEIEAAIIRLRSASPEPLITLMYGHQNFPTLPEDVHMGFMSKLKKLFELPIGYQDHCDADDNAAFWLPAASVGMGVDVLEKHITHDRSLKGIDHESALNPDEFRQFVEMVRVIERASDTSYPRHFSPAEKSYREFQKKSIVAARDLPAGHVLGADDVLFMRAEVLGMSPNKLEDILGRQLARKVVAFEPILEVDSP
ncbi:N-acetylneuraminate synthase family protein [Litorivicinus sp.]|nr:N-acetylneuraminate synthase family protein [Litorivicinus sp.]MDC1239987.1 N-acetylneuraminate synthase family protein [Litorivicinus sp.]